MEDSLVTTPSLRSGGDLREARHRYSEGQSMDTSIGGRGYCSNVAEPGILTVTGPASSKGGDSELHPYRQDSQEATSLTSEQATSHRTDSEQEECGVTIA